MVGQCSVGDPRFLQGVTYAAEPLSRGRTKIIFALYLYARISRGPALVLGVVPVSSSEFPASKLVKHLLTVVRRMSVIAKSSAKRFISLVTTEAGYYYLTKLVVRRYGLR